MKHATNANYASVLEIVQSGKYHSCVITGYSFDFLYFDEIVFPNLKRKGIGNLVLLIDTMMLDQSVERAIARSSNNPKGYVVAPIRTKGAFHPKAMLFFGQKEGLMTIGSGNPTYGGYGGNWEIWFSAHVDGEDDDKRYAFYRLWQYINYHTSALRGIANRKLAWMQQNSPWMPTNRNDMSRAEKLTFSILDNYERSIYSKLRSILPNSKADVINAYAPFLDSDLAAIKAIYKDYKPETFNLFVQPNYPSANVSELLKLPRNINFYNIEDCLNDSERNKYIHAKVIEFQFQKQHFLLLGSANLTVNALGCFNKEARNAEVSALLQLKSRPSCFKTLGIKPTNRNLIKRNQLKEIFAEMSALEQSTKEQSDFKYQILEIDDLPDEYKVTCGDIITEPIGLNVIDSSGNLLLSLTNQKAKAEKSKENHMLIFKKPYSLKCPPAFGFLIELKTKKRVSNHAVISDYVEQTKTNPNPAIRSFQNTIHAIGAGEQPLIKIFDLFSPEIVHKESLKGGGQVIKNEEETVESGLDAIPQEEMERLRVDNIEPYEFRVQYEKANALQTIDILNKILRQYESDNIVKDAENEEDVDIDNTDGSENIDDDKDNNRIQWHVIHNTKSAQKKAKRYFDRYLDILEKLRGSKENISNYNLAFAIHAITTDLLIHYSLRSFETVHGKKIDSLIPIIETQNDKCFLWYGLYSIGIFYSICQRKITPDSKELKNIQSDPLFKAVKLGTLNCCFIICAAISLKQKEVLPQDTKYVIDICIREFFNVLEVSNKYEVEVTYSNIKQHFEAILSNVSRGEIGSLHELLKIFKILSNAYQTRHVGQKAILCKNLDECELYFHNLYGFTYVRDVKMNGAQSEASFRFGDLGGDWVDELSDFVSGKFSLPPAPLFHAGVSVRSIKTSLFELEKLFNKKQLRENNYQASMPKLDSNSVDSAIKHSAPIVTSYD